MSTLAVSLIQTPTCWQDPVANRALFDQWMAQLPTSNQLVVLPEMFSTGFTMNSRQVGEPMNGPTVGWLQSQAAHYGQAIAGSLVIEDGSEYYNRFLCARPDNALVQYDKCHGFRMAGEHESYKPGERRVNFTLEGFRICPIICYDLRFPVFCRNRGDYDVLLCVANWPAVREPAWRTLLQARAIENQCYVVAVNVLGEDGNGVVYNGASLILGPEGDVLVDAGNAEGIFYTTLDMAHLVAYREAFPAWQDADHFELPGIKFR